MINKARQYLFSAGSFEWDTYFGSLITVTNKKQYDITKYGVYNYFTDSRNTTGATVNNVTVSAKQDCSFDSTYNLAKCTATGSNPSVARTSLTTLNNGRVSASVWLKISTANNPGTITLTLSDASDAQSVTATITNDGTLQRYGISGYFTSASTACKLKISWTSTTGVLYLDGWQIENNDWPSETITNTSTTAATERLVYADPLRVLGIASYRYNAVLRWTDVPSLDPTMLPHDYSSHNLLRGDTRYSLTGYGLNLENVDPGTHLVYYGFKKPKLYTADSDIFDVPAPEVWTIVEGVIAYLKAAKYDIGSNTSLNTHWNRFEAHVADMVNTSRNQPGWGYSQVLYPHMMR